MLALESFKFWISSSTSYIRRKKVSSIEMASTGLVLIFLEYHVMVAVKGLLLLDYMNIWMSVASKISGPHPSSRSKHYPIYFSFVSLHSIFTDLIEVLGVRACNFFTPNTDL